MAVDMSKTPARMVRVVDLVGNAGVRRLVGKHLNPSGKAITRHRLLRLRANREFPPPIKTLDKFEVWDRADVKDWLKDRQ